MAAEVDIDLYAENIDEDFNQDSEFNGAGVDLYDDVITAPSGSSQADTNENDDDKSSNSGAHSTAPGGKRIALYVGNLTWWTTDQDLTDSITSLGVTDMLDIKFYENRTNGQSKGFATITLGSDTSSRTLLERLAKKELHGQQLVVTHCNRQALSQFEAQARKDGSSQPPKPPPSRSGPPPQQQPQQNNRGNRGNFMNRGQRPSGPGGGGGGGPPQGFVPPGHLGHPGHPGHHQRQPPPGMILMQQPRGPMLPQGMPRGMIPPRAEWERPPVYVSVPTPGYQVGPPPGMPGPPPGLPPPGHIMGGPPHGVPPAPHVNPAFFPGAQPPPSVAQMMHHDPYRPPAPMFVQEQYRPPTERLEAQPTISDGEFEEILQRNKSVSSSAISRAVQDASGGEYASAIETLVTAISLIKQSKIANDDRCKILISSLQDTLKGIEEKSYGSRDRERSRDRRSRSRERGRRRDRSRSRERDYRERSRDRERDRVGDRYHRDHYVRH